MKGNLNLQLFYTFAKNEIITKEIFVINDGRKCKDYFVSLSCLCMTRSVQIYKLADL